MPSVRGRVIGLLTTVPDECRGHAIHRNPAIFMDSVRILMPAPDKRRTVHRGEFTLSSRKCHLYVNQFTWLGS